MKKTTTILMIVVLLISLALFAVSCVFVRVEGHSPAASSTETSKQQTNHPADKKP